MNLWLNELCTILISNSSYVKFVIDISKWRKQVLLQLTLQTWNFKHLIKKSKYIYFNQSIMLNIYIYICKTFTMKNGSKF
jgi:hypothetical protein